MKSQMFIMGMVLSMFLCGASSAEDIALELVMPGTVFRPGSPCSLDLNVNNTGAALSGAKLYVVLTLGSGEFWFYPNWVHYPPVIDYIVVHLAGQTEKTLRIVPEFSWPEGSGEFYGAMFYAAVMYSGNQVGNLAEYTFGWSETPPGALFSIDAIVGNMRFIPSGSFTQGPSDNEPCRDSDESLFTHFLTQNIAVMETEVSRQMWVDLRAVQPSLPEDPSDVKSSPTPAHPVQYVSWYGSVLFANLLSLHNGYSPCYFKDATFTIPVDATNYTVEPFFCNFTANGYRLPSEGEWEYCCRAGTTTPFSCNEMNYTAGNCDSCVAGTHPTLEHYCIYCANEPGATQVVGSKLPNPWNLKDVHGNVWEWCWDWYAYYPTDSQINYTGPGTGAVRVIRGGSWSFVALYCRSADRDYVRPGARLHGLGFRLVRSVLLP